MKIHNIFFIRTKSPRKYRIQAYTYRIDTVAFCTGNVHKCQQMPAYVGERTAYYAYDQRTLRMATVIIRKLYVKYVTQLSGIRQDVHIRCRYTRHTLEVRYSYAINTLVVRYCTVAVRYIFMSTCGNVCPLYLTYE